MALTSLALAAAFALQPVGSFHGDETVARDGERWLALRATPGGAALVPARVHVRAVHDAVVDAPGGASGREVSADVEGASVLLRGPGLRAGAVGAAAIGPEPRLLGESAIALRLQGRDYRLSLDCDVPAADARCRIRLAQGARRQVLLEIAAGRADDGRLLLGDDASPALWFAGDLDRDGRLDLLLDTSDHYNVGRPTLLLSSQARAGELVRPVATHRSTGC